MTEKEIMHTAQEMFLNNSGRKDVIDFLLSKGIAQEAVEAKATSAFLAIKEQRKALNEIAAGETKEAKSNSAIFGGLILLGAIVASLTTGRIWYGAMIVGVIMLVKGLGFDGNY